MSVYCSVLHFIIIRRIDISGYELHVRLVLTIDFLLSVGLLRPVIKFDDVGATTFNVSWELNDPTVVQYIITVTSNDHEALDTATPTQTTKEVSNLEQCTTYAVRIQAERNGSASTASMKFVTTNAECKIES